MSITDELREIAAKTECANGRCEKLYRGDLEHIADRIDAKHERQCAESWMRGHDAWAAIDRSDEMAEHGWIRLPKDADGEYVHIGDVMESGDGDVFTVSSVDYGLHPSNGRGKFWMLWNEDADFYECAYECRHHKQPTVEDVLYESLKHFGAVEERTPEVEEWLHEQAAKLCLAGDGE